MVAHNGKNRPWRSCETDWWRTTTGAPSAGDRYTDKPGDTACPQPQTLSPYGKGKQISLGTQSLNCIDESGALGHFGGLSNFDNATKYARVVIRIIEGDGGQDGKADPATVRRLALTN